MQAELIVLRLIHVLGGLFWVGTGLFTTLFLVPALTPMGPAAGQVMAGLQARRLYTILPVVGLLTLLSGGRLLWILSDGFSGAYFQTPMGATFALSGVAATLAFVLAMLVSRPAAARAGRLGASLGSTTDEASRAALVAEMGRLRRRSVTASSIAVTLLVLGAAGMAVARYVN